MEYGLHSISVLLTDVRSHSVDETICELTWAVMVHGGVGNGAFSGLIPHVRAAAEGRTDGP